MSYASRITLTLGAALMPLPAFAAIDGADTAWLMVATALVMFMTPGLAFFYAGMVRRKNVVSTLYQNFIAMGAIGLVWAVIGYSIAFSGEGAFFGDSAYALLHGVGQEPLGEATIPHLLFMAYQMMFAIITPALITGAFAERVRFSAWLIFLVLWSVVVYAPLAHWVWAPGGWLFERGVQDFAGGLVVHMSAGFSALIAAIMFRKRRDFGQPAKAYNLGMVAIGTAMLWFGWFGFNGGSALGANGLAVQAFVNTFFASAMALIVWTVIDKMKDGKPTLMGGCIGVVAGLVAITPAAGFVSADVAIFIGAMAGFICNIIARGVKARGIDDSLDVFACHGVGGLLGIIMTGIFASPLVNAASGEGAMWGDRELLTTQIVAAIAVAVYSMLATFVLLKIVGGVMPIRVSDADEASGLDITQHGESIDAG